MSWKRQPAVRTFGVTPAAGRLEPPQSKDWGQLLYATQGLMAVETGGSRWLVPGHRALWAPPGVCYVLDLSGPVRLRNLYIARGYCRALPRECRTVNVTPLLRELILHTTALGALHRERARERRVLDLLMDQLRDAREATLQLPMPTDSRGARVAELIWRDPACETDLAALARQCGASARTLERIFLREAGLTFRRWRQRARALHALRLLAQKRPVNDVALEVGYSTPSAFIAMFRAEFGTTPGRYFEA